MQLDLSLVGKIETFTIYLLINLDNDKIYIGSSTDIKARQDKHISSLGNNKHENNHLKHAYNKYGITAYRLTASFPSCIHTPLYIFVTTPSRTRLLSD